jgi:hypothetical protein
MLETPSRVIAPAAPIGEASECLRSGVDFVPYHCSLKKFLLASHHGQRIQFMAPRCVQWKSGRGQLLDLRLMS